MFMSKNPIVREEIPEYIIQPNVISQAIYQMNPYARKLIAIAMALISIDSDEYTVTFKSSDFIRAMGLEPRTQGANTKARIKAAVEECLDCKIKINMPNGDWVGYTWITESRLHKIDNQNKDAIWEYITMTFNSVLGNVIKTIKRGFRSIDLLGFLSLQSEYSMRIYELALSYSGFAGRDGNKPGHWYFETTIRELRLLFKIDDGKYKIKNEFRRNVIDKPIEEINAADLGLQIEVEYIRSGRYMTGIRFNCRWIKKESELSSSNIPGITEKDREDEALAVKYPEEYEKYKSEYLESMTEKYAARPEMLELLEHAAEGHALEKLKEMHAAPAPPNVTPQKRGRGRPRKNPVPASQ
jgi:plasmid replication initiation protein